MSGPIPTVDVTKQDNSVLEPSAGKGNIADLVRELHPSAKLDVIECNAALREILRHKGHNITAWDCLEVNNPIYQVIVMNPPFEQLADIDHVQHAFNNLLVGGGRLVSVMGESAFFRQDKKALAFRAWLAELGGGVIDLPAGAFKESGTGVKTRVIVVDKPSSQTPALSQPTVIPEEMKEDFGAFIESLPQKVIEAVDTLAAAMAEVMQANFEAVSQQAYSEALEESETLQNYSFDEEGDFIPAYPDEADSRPSEPQQKPITLASEPRDIQKALPGTGANDRLLKLHQTKFF